jgi:hypothetical protein
MPTSPAQLTFTAPNAPNDAKYQSSVAYLSNYASALTIAGNQFMQGLVDDTLFDWTSVGDLPTLGYGYVDFTGDLATAAGDKPDRLVDLSTLLGQIDSALASATGLAVPTPPSITTPTLDAVADPGAAPTISLPSAPSWTLPATPGAAPTLDTIALPADPVYSMPDLPSISGGVSIPSAPSITLPTWSAVAPTLGVSAPTNTYSYVEAGYASSLKDALVAKLLDDLTNGGYGLDAADANRIFQDARDREQAVAQQNVDEITRTFASSGFPLPPGALVAAVQRANADLLAKLSNVNREILSKEADLYSEHRKFTIQQVQEYEQQARAMYNAIAERALNHAKYTVEMGIAIYDANVKAYNAAVAAYQTEAHVFESRIKAAATQVELYRAQLEGVQSVVSVYRTRMEAANIASELQKARLENYRVSVQAYAEMVRAKEAEFDAYGKGVQAQIANVEAYKTTVDAYRARIDASKAKAEVTTMGNEALLASYDASIKTYNAQLTAFLQSVDARTKQMQTVDNSYRADVDLYRAYIGALVETARAQIAQQGNNNEWNRAVLASHVDKIRFNMQKFTANVDHFTSVKKFGAEYFRGAIESALNGINGLTVATGTA